MAEKKKRGRPMGSGEGYDAFISSRLHADDRDALDRHAEALGIDRGTLIRDILTEWIERQSKGKAKR